MPGETSAHSQFGNLFSLPEPARGESGGIKTFESTFLLPRNNFLPNIVELSSCAGQIDSEKMKVAQHKTQALAPKKFFHYTTHIMHTIPILKFFIPKALASLGAWVIPKQEVVVDSSNIVYIPRPLVVFVPMLMAFNLIDVTLIKL